jgi:hypothetical protein
MSHYRITIDPAKAPSKPGHNNDTVDATRLRVEGDQITTLKEWTRVLGVLKEDGRLLLGSRIQQICARSADSTTSPVNLLFSETEIDRDEGLQEMRNLFRNACETGCWLAASLWVEEICLESSARFFSVMDARALSERKEAAAV